METVPASRAFDDLVRARASCRAYDPQRPVPRPLLRRCLDSARQAPSACNRQPWRFVVVDDPARLTALRRQARLPGIPHRWWDAVPVFLVLCAQPDVRTHRLAAAVAGIPYLALDVGGAGTHFVLAATELGLGTCWIGWFRKRRVRKLLGIPRAVRVMAMITVGYPLTPRPEPRTRRPLAELLHWNRWGNHP